MRTVDHRAPKRDECGFAPPSGAAFSIALHSHRERCRIGINADATAVPDSGALVASIADSFAELLSVGETPRRSPRTG